MNSKWKSPKVGGGAIRQGHQGTLWGSSRGNQCDDLKKVEVAAFHRAVDNSSAATEVRQQADPGTDADN